MQKTLEDAKNGNAAAVERVRKAFGPNPDLDGIKKNVDILHTGTVPISKLSPDEVDKAWNGGKPLKKGQTGIIAITPFDYRKSANDPLTVDPVQFGTGFNVGAESRKMNAATVLHEATHSLLHTSDDHYKDGTMDVVPMGVEHSDAQWKNIKEQGGYANKSPVIATDGNPITDAHLSANFKKFRDSATNVVVNADSYSLLGAICDSEMERLRKRAIMRGDVRGGASCKHPPDYFAKKVAAAKASKEKAAGLTPTGQKGKATGLTPAGQKMVKGAKTLGTGKGTSKVVGKAGKSALTKTPKPSLGKSPLKGSKSALSTGRTSKTGTRGTLSKAKTPGLSKSSRMKAPNGKLSKTLSKTSTRAKGSKVLSKSAGIKGSKTGTRESKAMSKSTSMKGSKARSKSAGMKASKTSTRGSKATSKSAGMKGSKAGSNSTRHQVTVESGSQGDLQGRRPSRHLEVDGRQIAFQNSSRQDLESGLFRSLGFQERRHAEKWCSRRETDEGYIHSCLYSSSRKADFQVIIEGHGSQVVQGTNLQSDLSRAESRRVGF